MASNNLGFAGLQTTPERTNIDGLHWTSRHDADFGEFLAKRDLHIMERFVPLHQHEPVLAVDLDFNIIFVNSKAKNRIFKNTNSLLNRSLKDLIEVEDAKGGLSSWEELLRLGLLVGNRFTRQVRTPSGLRIPAMITGSPIFAHSGDLAGTAILIKPRQSWHWPSRNDKRDAKKDKSSTVNLNQLKYGIVSPL